MNDHEDRPLSQEEAMTLDPPGHIAVVGAGLNGIEAALYGRFLGYDVTLIEANRVGGLAHTLIDEPLPVLPARCASTLAFGALQAQRSQREMVFPTTPQQWLDDVIAPLVETDLLRGRLRCPFQVQSVTTVPEPELDDDQLEGVDEDCEDEIPPDFRLVGAAEGDTAAEIVAEAVIIATGRHEAVSTDFELPAPYFFSIATVEQEGGSESSWESCMRAAQKQIVAIYATLAGRDSLDLYRPRRM